MTGASTTADVLTKAKTTPDVVDMPARHALAIDGVGAPGADAFRRSLQALYGVAYTMKFARKRTDALDFKVAPLEGDWRIDPGARVEDRDSWRWRLRIMVPEDVTAGELQAAVDAATTKKGGKLFGSTEATRVFLEEIPPHRFGRILHVRPYATEPESFATLEHLLDERGLRREPWHTEVYLSDPGRTPPEKIRTALLVQVAAADAQ